MLVTPPGDGTPPIRLAGGAVAIDGLTVLRDVDMVLEQGEFVALMGANGSGKSTLVRALTGLRSFTNGTYELFGHPAAELSERRRLGYVPQRSGATTGVPASVWEVVAAGRLPHRRWLRPLGRTDRAAVAEALEIVGLGHRARDLVSTLSGGQQQRVLIARALAAGPELLFLDEPTAGVDLSNQRALAEALGHLKSLGATVLLVTHELGPLAPLVDRVLVLRDGRMTDDGAGAGDDPHTHHHPEPGPVDHFPDVRAPLEG